jgi:Uma2 family endonuclease
VATQSVTKITEEEYLGLERAAQHKSEFVHGEIFAMAGGSLQHALIAVNFSSELKTRLSNRNCRVFSSDLKIRTAVSGCHLYPDVSVVCGAPQRLENSVDVLTNPNVVIEVLFPSTANYDRGQKFELYREIASLGDYVLVHTASPHVEHFSRQADNSWIFREYRGLETSVTLTSIGCTVALGDVYAGALDLPE